MKILPIILAVVAIVAIGCGQIAQMTPAPEVEIVFVTPVAGIYVPGSPADTIEMIQFQVFNGVDAVIKSMDYDYFGSDGTPIVDSLPIVGMHLVVPGDLEVPGPTDLLNVPVPMTAGVVNYIQTTGDFVNTKLTFRGVDHYGLEKKFEVEMDWGIMTF